METGTGAGRGGEQKALRELKAGQSVSLHGINLLPLANLSDLHLRIENDHPNLRELTLGGLPRGAFATEEYELVFEALGSNTSIGRLSMRRSCVDDDLASLFALALVDNAALTQLDLGGNDMTTVSGKNFYSVLKKNNDTLRMLDLSDNPGIDDDVEEALDRFMEQRALKRTLTNKQRRRGGRRGACLRTRRWTTTATTIATGGSRSCVTPSAVGPIDNQFELCR